MQGDRPDQISPLEPDDPRRIVVADLWRALAEDDDQAIEALFLPYRLGQIVELGPGVAARLRDTFGRSRDDCARMDVHGMVPFKDDPDACVVGSRRRDLSQNVVALPALFTLLTLQRLDAFTFRVFDEVLQVATGWYIWGEAPSFEGGTVLDAAGLS
jgi:hypothetical protein